MILGECAAQPEDSLFITDTLGDIREAKQSRVQAIAVSWGFHEKNVLLQGKPYSIAHRPEDITQAVKRYFAL
jgi:phosphoglycolate phosphatase